MFGRFNRIILCNFLKIKNLDYDMATQRMCVQRGPSDSEDRCAHTVYNYKKVYMCFCQGDLCNTAADSFVPNFWKLSLISLAVILHSLTNY